MARLTKDASGFLIDPVAGIGSLNGQSGVLTNFLWFQGDYDASINSPALSNGTGLEGDLYHVSFSGSHDFGAGSITLAAGDHVFYNGTVWVKWATSGSGGSFDPTNPGPIGGTTPAAGTFTTLTAAGFIENGASGAFFFDGNQNPEISPADGSAFFGFDSSYAPHIANTLGDACIYFDTNNNPVIKVNGGTANLEFDSNSNPLLIPASGSGSLGFDASNNPLLKNAAGVTIFDCDGSGQPGLYNTYGAFVGIGAGSNPSMKNNTAAAIFQCDAYGQPSLLDGHSGYASIGFDGYWNPTLFNNANQSVFSVDSYNQGQLVGLGNTLGFNSAGLPSYNSYPLAYTGDGVQLSLGASGGTMFGLSGDKIGFMGTAPKPVFSSVSSTNMPGAGSSAAVFNDSQFDGNLGGSWYTIGDIIACLKNYGLMVG